MIFKKKPRQFFSPEEQAELVKAIQDAEACTSGEVRLYVESKCRFMDAVDRARELFGTLKMQATEERNATLVYIAFDDRQAAVFGDEGIHQRVGAEFWNRVVGEMLERFRSQQLVDGLCLGIRELGRALSTHFPHAGDQDRNELPDDIVFGS